MFLPSESPTIGALFNPPDVQRGGPEVDLIPPQFHQLGNPQAVPVGHQDHRGTKVLPLIDYGLGQKATCGNAGSTQGT
jgi:hypothetical protein